MRRHHKNAQEQNERRSVNRRSALAAPELRPASAKRTFVTAPVKAANVLTKLLHLNCSSVRITAVESVLIQRGNMSRNTP